MTKKHSKMREKTGTARDRQAPRLLEVFKINRLLAFASVCVEILHGRGPR